FGWLRAIEGMNDALQCAAAARGWAIFDNLVRKYHHAHCVVLPRGHIGEACAQIFAELQLAHSLALKTHRGAAVEHDHQMAVGFAKKTFDISLVGARKDVPVYIARIVAFTISAVFHELLA